MASNKKNRPAAEVVEAITVAEAPVVDAPVVEAPAIQNKSDESVYTAAELAANHKFFNTSREIVVVALQLAGKNAATEQEARAIIEKFKTKEVK